ncbi:MAG TPA: hypothetical protein VFU82_06885 [Gammaproteobacteria bacterium]|jgi:hypothetical protein|nr:hypothetical protein [Gammaproteobacteria bacterium]
MKIILVGSPEGKAAFVQSVQNQMACDDAREMRFHFPEHSDATVTMTSLSVDEINDPSAVNSIKHADAIIYAGMRALHKKALEVEFLPGFSAGTLLKNLTRLLQDHRQIH